MISLTNVLKSKMFGLFFNKTTLFAGMLTPSIKLFVENTTVMIPALNAYSTISLRIFNQISSIFH